MTKTNLLRFAALLSVFLPASAMAADSVAHMKHDPSRDYTVEGDVVTVWEDTFLLDDGTGQVIVNVAPRKNHDIGIGPRDYVQVSGHMDGSQMKPLTIVEAGRQPVLFTGTSTMEEIPLAEVMRNTARYRMPVKHHTLSNAEPAAASSATDEAPKTENAAATTSLSTDSLKASCLDSGSPGFTPPNNMQLDAFKQLCNQAGVPTNTIKANSSAFEPVKPVDAVKPAQ